MSFCDLESFDSQIKSVAFRWVALKDTLTRRLSPIKDNLVNYHTVFAIMGFCVKHY